MPTYEYACKSCGHHLEVVHSFKDSPLAECPTCGGPLRRVFSSIGVVFKGSGFYRTDSRASSTSKPSTSGKAKEQGEKKGGSEGTGTGTGTGSGSGSGSSGPKAERAAAAS